MGLKLPVILDVPDKLLPLIERFDEFRYFLIEGGRSSAKSQTIARFISYLCEQKSLRVVCGRETQNTIEESVYTIFADLIRFFNLNFNVSASKIDHKITKSAIRFRGFREQGMMNIKGLEGVDVLWVEEAQSITKQTLDIIIPTIRKENSKIIWSMNRYVENDPVYVAMAGRTDCLHIHIDYNENRFCPKAMKAEAEVCRAKSEDDYNYIWLGQPLKKGDDSLLSNDVVYNSPNIILEPGISRTRIMGIDVARFGDDETVFTVIEQKNLFQWEQIFQEAHKGKDTAWTTGYAIDLSRKLSVNYVIVDDVGIGGGVTDGMRNNNRPVIPFIGNEASRKPLLYENRKAEAFFVLKDLLDRGWLKINKDIVLAEQLLSIKYKFKANGTKAIIGKDEMRKEGLKSPDRCEALCMACFATALTPSVLSNTYQMPREAECSTVIG